MADFRIESEDPIQPTRITHSCETLWNGDQLAECYNYLVYEFEIEDHTYRARSYLDSIQSVSVYGPFAKGSAGGVPVGTAIDPRVVSYLRRRYTEITKLGPNGYVPIR